MNLLVGRVFLLICLLWTYNSLVLAHLHYRQVVFLKLAQLPLT